MILSGKYIITTNNLLSIQSMMISDIYDNFPFVNNFKQVKFDKGRELVIQ